MPRALISNLGENGHFFNMAKTINASFSVSVLFHKKGEGGGAYSRGGTENFNRRGDYLNGARTCI